MDRRLLIIPVVIVIGIAVLWSGVLNFSDDDVPVETEEVVTEEPETIFQSADVNDTDLNESVVENETTPNLGGGMGGMGGAPTTAPVTSDPSTGTDNGTTDNTDEEDQDTTSNPTVYTFNITVVN
ncbi:MAG: hypothetical protein PWP14_2223 [Methanolobus sp.]|jgi:hypothetical protein|nr:hypothetical protein [Methanolobus sp.]